MGKKERKEKMKQKLFSECHHAEVLEYEIEAEEDVKYPKRIGTYICPICKQPCKVVELLEEESK